MGKVSLYEYPKEEVVEFNALNIGWPDPSTCMIRILTNNYTWTKVLFRMSKIMFAMSGVVPSHINHCVFISKPAARS
jgi:hypothetical protein